MVEKDLSKDFSSLLKTPELRKKSLETLRELPRLFLDRVTKFPESRWGSLLNVLGTLDSSLASS